MTISITTRFEYSGLNADDDQAFARGVEVRLGADLYYKYCVEAACRALRRGQLSGRHLQAISLVVSRLARTAYRKVADRDTVVDYESEVILEQLNRDSDVLGVRVQNTVTLEGLTYISSWVTVSR